jgi:hypothetical protein
MLSNELQLAGEGRFDELVKANAARQILISSLPATPPAAAREPLQLVALMQERLNIEVQRGREAMLMALTELQRAQRAARGYAPPSRGPRVSTTA